MGIALILFAAYATLASRLRKLESAMELSSSSAFHAPALGQSAGHGLVAAAEGALGLSLPLTPNTLSTDGADRFALWTSPDEFMIDVPFDGDSGLLAALTEALADGFALVADVSDQMAGIGLGGEQWREVWSKVCALDVHESVFQPGACGQTVAAKSNILFYGPAAGAGSVEHVRLYTRRSFSQYLFARLEDAALEYGLSFTAL